MCPLFVLEVQKRKLTRLVSGPRLIHVQMDFNHVVIVMWLDLGQRAFVLMFVSGLADERDDGTDGASSH